MVEKIAVVGAGLMGTGIAHAFAIKSYPVVLIDNNANALSKGMSEIRRITEDGVKLGKVSADAAQAALDNLKASPAIDENVSSASLVIETATERLDIKQSILKLIDELAPAHAVLATNTSALSISELAVVTRRPAQVVGMHFFNPVQKMKLVEVIRGVETSDATVEKARHWAQAIGKTSVLINEAPGFATSRISALLGNEAMCMLAEGVASAEDIDTSLRLAFNHPMGPLELGDLTGWDTRLLVLQYLHSTLGDKFRPNPLILKMVKAGRHGKKVGRGVYEYDADGQRIPGSGLRVQS